MGTHSPTRPLVVVAGATGYLGGHVVVALAEAGFRVRALARNPAKLEPIQAYVDEVFVGEATRPETLYGLFDDACAVFSSIGVRYARRRPTFWTVDRDANLALVEAAAEAGVQRFVFTSVFEGQRTRREIPLVEAREQVVDHLREEHRLQHTVLRPTGLFNDMAGLFEMARADRYWVFGSGRTRLNPVHAADVADQVVACLRAPEPPESVDIGGPDSFTFAELGQVAFAALGRTGKVRHAPLWLARALRWVVTPFSGNLAGILAGLYVGSRDGAEAPAVGRRPLRALFEQLAGASASVALTPGREAPFV